MKCKQAGTVIGFCELHHVYHIESMWCHVLILTESGAKTSDPIFCSMQRFDWLILILPPSLACCHLVRYKRPIRRGQPTHVGRPAPSRSPDLPTSTRPADAAPRLPTRLPDGPAGVHDRPARFLLQSASAALGSPGRQPRLPQEERAEEEEEKSRQATEEEVADSLK